MVDPAIQEQILRDLDRLPPALQRRASEFVRSLDPSRVQGASVEDLLSVSGTLDKESAREMREAIEQGCERVEPCEW